MQPKTLTTAELELSVPTESDTSAIFLACQDPVIQHFTTVPVPYLLEHAAGFIEAATHSWRRGTEATWAIRKDDELVGMIGLRMTGPGEAELGFWTAPLHRGQGHVKEAARAVIDYGFDPCGLGLQRIEWRAHTDNPASAAVARSLGFQYEGTLRSQGVNGSGERFDSWVASLLPDDPRRPVSWPEGVC